MRREVHIYTDGAYDWDKKKGRYAFCVVINEQKIYEFVSEYVSNTTSQRMELQAFLDSLEYMNNGDNENKYIVFSDSEYVVKSFNLWINNWVRSDYKNGKVKNIDLMETIYAYKTEYLTKSKQLKVQWVKAHSGVFWNEYVDSLIEPKRGLKLNIKHSSNHFQATTKNQRQ